MNNYYIVYSNAKYIASYWPQEPKLLEFRETNKLLRRSDIKDDKFNIGNTFHNNKATRAAYQEHANLNKVILEVETKTTTEWGLVIVIILLNIISIAL